MIYVYASNASVFSDDSLYQKAYDISSKDRKAKTDRYRNPKDKYLSVCAECLLKYGLKKANVEFPDSFEYNEYNKPYIKDSDIHFNISHSGDFTICAVSDSEIGCDIELLQLTDIKLCEQFAQEEKDDIYSLKTDVERIIAMYRYWTLKESFMKAVGMGMALDPSDFRIVNDKTISVIQNINENEYSFTECKNIVGYKIAVCVKGSKQKVKFDFLDIKKLLESEEIK